MTSVQKRESRLAMLGNKVFMKEDLYFEAEVALAMSHGVNLLVADCHFM
jgi:hypothetical protein